MTDMGARVIDYLFIGGQRVAPATDKTISVISPWDEQLVAVVPEGSRDAVAIANDSQYGLSGSVFTADIEAGIALADRIDSGTFGVNAFGNDITAPFGGVKASGLDREMGPEGLAEYLEFQSVLLPAV